MYSDYIFKMIDLDSFQLVCNYIIQSHYKKLTFTPSANVISAMQEYNKIRAKAAKRIVKNLPNSSIINSFRTARSICQINTCPPYTRCSFTKEPLEQSHGATLIVKHENDDTICIQQSLFGVKI